MNFRVLELLACLIDSHSLFLHFTAGLNNPRQKHKFMAISNLNLILGEKSNYLVLINSDQLAVS